MADRSLSEKERQQRLRQIGAKKPVVEQALVIWGHNDAVVVNGVDSNNLDLSAFKIGNLHVPPNYQRPRFRSEAVKAGEILCRTGYPLLQDKLEIVWDGNKFVANGWPALFVNSGLVSRFLNGPHGRIIEIDSPGLSGQSGGPLFDHGGGICGIQHRTTHYPLGFETTPQTYFHVGQAIDVSSVREFLDSAGIEYLT